MCFFFVQSKKAVEAKKRFKAEIKTGQEFQSSEKFNAFTFPTVSVIANIQPDIIQNFQWGLIPSWATDTSIQKFTLNARIETLAEKPAFKESINQRCLVLANGFFEWQWLDAKGKNKQEYLISLPNDELFAFGGIWSQYLNKQTNSFQNTFSIVTTQANELMSEIHNSKKRMPLILTPENEKYWLNHLSINEFANCNPKLKATKIEQQKPQLRINFE